MAEYQLPKQFLYCELVNGGHMAQKPKMGYKDCLKTALKVSGIDELDWETYDRKKKFETEKVRQNKLKRYPEKTHK